MHGRNCLCFQLRSSLNKLANHLFSGLIVSKGIQSSDLKAICMTFFMLITSFAALQKLSFSFIYRYFENHVSLLLKKEFGTTYSIEADQGNWSECSLYGGLNVLYIWVYRWDAFQFNMFQLNWVYYLIWNVKYLQLKVMYLHLKEKRTAYIRERSRS